MWSAFVLVEAGGESWGLPQETAMIGAVSPKSGIHHESIVNDGRKLTPWRRARRLGVSIHAPPTSL
jgi:hypothetical protein